MRTLFLIAAVLTALATGTLAQAGQSSQAVPAISPAAANPQFLNNIVPLLNQDKPIFGLFVNYVGVGSDQESAVGHSRDPNYDYYVYDIEHSALDISRLGQYLQWLIDRQSVAQNGIAATKSVFVRMTPNAREMNEWLIKNVLDTGVHGLVFPHTETVDQVILAIRAMRYPQKPGVADFEPEGIRGSSPGIAARYWGVSGQEYQQRSDIWRLDPQGNLIPIFIIENQLGVQNVRAIAKALKDRNIGAILWAGRGDMSVSYAGDQDAVAKGLDAVIAAGREFGFPVGLNMPEDVVKRTAQGARMFTTIGNTGKPVSAEARKAVGR